MEIGVITFIQVCYRIMQMERDIDLTDKCKVIEHLQSRCANSYAVSIIEKIWLRLLRSIFETFWRHMRISLQICQAADASERSEQQLERNKLEGQISSLASVWAKMSIVNFLNGLEGQNCVEEFNEEHALFADVEDGTREESVDVNYISDIAAQEEEIPLPPLQEQWKALAMVKSLFVESFWDRTQCFISRWTRSSRWETWN